jgi:hypothetical protein
MAAFYGDASMMPLSRLSSSSSDALPVYRVGVRVIEARGVRTMLVKTSPYLVIITYISKDLSLSFLILYASLFSSCHHTFCTFQY